MRRLILTLTILGLISAFILAFVYQWTTPYIEEHQAEAQKNAILEVLPGSDNYREVSKNGLTFFEGNKDGEVAMLTSGGGFQGEIELMIGFNVLDNKIFGIRVLNHQETPGLGANITGEKYQSNFAGKPFPAEENPYTVVKRPAQSPYEVEAISGATISSAKVTDIIEKAVQEIEEAYGGES